MPALRCQNSGSSDRNIRRPIILRDTCYSRAYTGVVIADALLRSGSVRVCSLRISPSVEADHGWNESSVSQRLGNGATIRMLLPVPAQQGLHNIRQGVSSRWYGRTLAGSDHRNSPSLLSKRRIRRSWTLADQRATAAVEN